MNEANNQKKKQKIEIEQLTNIKIFKKTTIYDGTWYEWRGGVVRLIIALFYLIFAQPDLSLSLISRSPVYIYTSLFLIFTFCFFNTTSMFKENFIFYVRSYTPIP